VRSLRVAFTALMREMTCTHALSSDLANPIERSRSSSSGDSKLGDPRSPDRHNNS
jgi:hypothetical protein